MNFVSEQFPRNDTMKGERKNKSVISVLTETIPKLLNKI